MSSAQTRDLVVVGASAGGVTALAELFGRLPADFPAAVVAVLHLAASSRSYLSDVLQRTSKLPIETVEDGAELRAGVIYVAPPDYHTIIRDGHLGLNQSPRESRHRPSIDALFRTAASARGVGVVGIVLTGALDDGAIGLKCIHREGGLAIVQDPVDAEFPSMPEHALRLVAAEHVVGLGEMGALLDRVVREPLSTDALSRFEAPPPLVDRHAPSGFTCPDGGGSRYECGKDRRQKA